MPLTSTYQARANKNYRESHRDKINETAKKYYLANKESIKAKKKLYYQRKKAETLLTQQNEPIVTI